MAATSATQQKHELRQKLESMKQVYARTLRKVEKSEKAKRARSHVQRRIAEQALLNANDTSPSCTHRPIRRKLDGGSHNTQEISPHIQAGRAANVDADEAPVVNVKVDEGEASKSMVATTRMQRKKRSVSFIIPKEKASSRSSIDDIQEKTVDTCRGTSEDETYDDQQTLKIKKTLPSGLHEQVPKTNTSIGFKEAPTRTSTDETQVEMTDSCLGASEVETLNEQKKLKLLKTSLLASQLYKTSKSVGVNGECLSAPSSGRKARDGVASKSSSIKDDGCCRNEPDEKAILLVPESQFTEPQDASLNKSICTHSASAATQPILHNSQGKKNVISIVYENQNAALSDNKICQENVKHCVAKISEQCLPTSISSPPEDLADNASKPFPTPHQFTTEMQTRRADCKNRRRSKILRELTMSDISMKEVAKSQSTEDGSHTWIEGLMYPVEYYVRRTRSMTTSQCSQSRSQLDRKDSQRRTVSDTTEARRKGAMDINSTTSLNPEVTTCTLFSSGKTGVAESAPESDSDTLKSQLSESLLKTTPAQPQILECTKFKESGSVKLTRSTKTSRRQRRRGICKRSPLTSGLKINMSAKLDTMPVSGEESAYIDALSKDGVITSSETRTPTVQDNQDSPTSQDLSDVKLIFAVGNLKLSWTEFSLPEEDFGAVKLLKLQSNSAEDIKSSKSNTKSAEAKQECRPKFDVENHSSHLFLKQKEDSAIDSLNTVKSKIDDTCTPVMHQQQCSADESSTVPPLTNAVRCPSTLQAMSDNDGSEIKPCAEAPKIQQSQVDINDGIPLTKEHGKEDLVGKENETKSSELTDINSHNSKSGASPSDKALQPSDIPSSQSRRCSHSPSNSQHVFPTSPGATSNTSVNASPPEPLSHKTTASDHSTQDITAAGGNVTPPNSFPAVLGDVSTDPRGNINQVSPFAGVATGTPPGRAEEPQAMSRCEVKSVSADDDEVVACGTDGRSRNELALMGCLQHDLPWENLPMVQDVTGGTVNVNGEDVSVLAVLYQHTLVIWWNYMDAVEWQVLQSWIIPKDEEYICVRFMPCSTLNAVSLVVAGMFSSCAVRILTFDTVTKESQQMDVDLAHSCEIPVPHLLCVTSGQEFAIVVKDTKNKSGVFLVHIGDETSDVQTLRLSAGMETSLTSLLQVEGAEGIIIATTSQNDILLWNRKTGELIKDVPLKPVSSGSIISCVKATAELGLLFLVMVFHADPSNQEATCLKPVGATTVLNPLTDKMTTLVEYHPTHKHANASLVDSVVHNSTLLVKLSDGSLHQWDIFSGILMNYSSSHPANHTLRSACLCKSQVVLLGSDQCQQVFHSW